MFSMFRYIAPTGLKLEKDPGVEITDVQLVLGIFMGISFYQEWYEIALWLGGLYIGFRIALYLGRHRIKAFQRWFF